MIGYDFWRTRMAQAPNVSSKTLQIDNRTMTVIGVDRQDSRIRTIPTCGTSPTLSRKRTKSHEEPSSGLSLPV